jgi:DNA-directed RNA polymerase beta' subunit
VKKKKKRKKMKMRKNMMKKRCPYSSRSSTSTQGKEDLTREIEKRS